MIPVIIMFLAFDTSLSVKNLFNATREISHDWYFLGLQLGLELDVLSSIQSRTSLSQDECCQEMFEVWLHIDLNASWEKLVDALDTMKCHRLAGSIKTEYADAKKEQGMLSPFFNSYL